MLWLYNYQVPIFCESKHFNRTTAGSKHLPNQKIPDAEWAIHPRDLDHLKEKMLQINVWLRQEGFTAPVPKCLVSWHLDPLQLGKLGARSPTDSIHLRRQPFLSSVQSRRFPSPQSFIFMPPWASTLHPVNLTSSHLNQLATPPSSASAFSFDQH